MSISRSTFRTAAVATGVTVAFALPMGAAFADDGAPTPKDDTVSTPDKGDRNKGDEDGQKDKTPQPSFVRSVKLVDGSTAKIYKTGENSYKAVVTANGAEVGTLVSTDGKPAKGELNGMFVVLNPDGNVVSWISPVDKPKPRPKPTPQPHKDTHTHANHPHTNHPHKQIPPVQPAPDQHKVLPKGGVKAGAENVSATSGAPDATLLAAGGGLAAAGAAGLGFAVLRRRGPQG
ncbi:hypothetical protein [Streptomyces sp. NPDC054863]